MNWLQFTDSMVGHLVWPIVVLIVIFAVRKHLGSLAQRILELSFGGATVKFGQLLSKGAQIIDESPLPKSPLPAPSEPRLPLPPLAIGPESAPANDLAPSASPQPSGRDSFRVGIESIFFAYDSVERILGEIGEQLGVKTRNGPTILSMLLKRDLIAPDVLELYNTLRLGRNAIAHGAAPLPNEAEILEYVRQSAYLATVLYGAKDKLRTDRK